MNGQSPTELAKNFDRVRTIIEKAKGDEDKEISLARKQANAILNEYKAINRALAARELGKENIFEIFFKRAYELGSVSQVDYRSYVISKLLND